MALIRSVSAFAAKRPSIHEIAASILTPTSKCCARLSLKASGPVRNGFALPKAERCLHTSSHLSRASAPPKSHDRGPVSSETTQTDFGKLDVLGGSPVPSTYVDACVWDGFHLNSGVKITNGAGVILMGGEAFGWRPWDTAGKGGVNLLNAKGQWEVADDSWGIFRLVWPKPDLLILGVGPSMVPLSPATRKFISNLGIRVDIQDTRNACAQFNLLATERGVTNVAAALVPIGWREGVGVKSSEE